ncbi:DUF547 domain-containing protein [Salegentibacter sp. F188]|uniref:DUF547 domain-containing protein n=1 Tax=Autumnicola patrickiae TaxID=3075591 RepID=A0ABU3E6H8_9FLAO|nr:DUF547 domain-containing protein [Salegentibacter sp. F188]MDT0691513.1 DUF547 domain-containing protein [Salegentibacter sp. F188]
MKHLTLLFLLFSAVLTAQDTPEFFTKADNFLKTYVENGNVKYAEIKENPEDLKQLLNLAKRFETNPEEEEIFKAFWINAYNLGVIDGIVKNYPVKSPLEIEGFFDKQPHSLGLKSVTLDEIEHELVFGNFPQEERFHFALVCAAKSCPQLISEAYMPGILEQQLQEQTLNTLNDPEFIRINGNQVLLSEIFNWYKEDFTSKGQSFIQYVNQFRTNKISERKTVDFYEYNWELNDL